jgi:hypothetical protein
MQHISNEERSPKMELSSESLVIYKGTSKDKKDVNADSIKMAIACAIMVCFESLLIH